MPRSPWRSAASRVASPLEARAFGRLVIIGLCNKTSFLQNSFLPIEIWRKIRALPSQRGIGGEAVVGFDRKRLERPLKPKMA